MQAFGDEPTNRPEADRDKISDTTNTVTPRNSQLDDIYIGLKSNQSLTVLSTVKTKEVKERGRQSRASVAFTSTNLPIIGSALEGIDKTVESKLDDLQKWFDSGSGGTADEAQCEFKIPASFDLGYVHAGNEENSDDCEPVFRPLNDADGAGGVIEHSCPTDTQGYYCSGDGELVEEDDQFFRVYQVSCDD